MSGKRPLFVSAPRLILGIEDSQGKFSRLAYAIGMSLRVSVNVVPINVVGAFAPVAYEPVQYMPVNLTLQIIKLQRKSYRDARVAKAKEFYKDNPMLTDPSVIQESMNSTAFSVDQNTGDVTQQSNSILEQAGIFKHLDPLNILTSETFDVKVYMNIAGFGDQLSKRDDLSNSPTTANIKVPNDLVPFITIKDCRLTGRSVNISQGQLLNEPVNAMGLLAVQNNEKMDSFIKEGVFG